MPHNTTETFKLKDYFSDRCNAKNEQIFSNKLTDCDHYLKMK